MVNCLESNSVGPPCQMVKLLFELVDPEYEGHAVAGLHSNLFNANPPFQIDGNFRHKSILSIPCCAYGKSSGASFCAAIAETLDQSTMEDLYLLPALPRDKWPSGCVKGLKARGDVAVSICWREGDLHQVGLWSKKHNIMKRLHHNGIVVTANLSSGRVYMFDKRLKCLLSHPRL